MKSQKLKIGIFLSAILSSVYGTTMAQDSATLHTEIREDILATIKSINELRLLMLKNEVQEKERQKQEKLKLQSQKQTIKTQAPLIEQALSTEQVPSSPVQTKNIKPNNTISIIEAKVTDNNKVLNDLSNDIKSNNIRLSILEKRTFSKADNDFNDYVTKSSKKVFVVELAQTRRGDIDCDAVTDTYAYTRTAIDDNIDITETITRHDVAGSICFEREIYKRKTPTELLYLSNQNKIFNNFPVDDLVTYTEPVIVLASSMKKGISFGSGGIITYQSNGQTNKMVFNKVSTMLSDNAELTLIVNDAEKTYSNCLIIGTRSNSTVSTEWYCPGDGMVKRVIFYPSVANKPARSEITTLRTITAY
ncbi:hypothetical protein MNBD_GAMMA22-2370 [hydrothermal vent metagenome]|uniref:Uncharacterized protein n=1 Tax=hydrothermal vent metagenome TaxID=652676 RepID=A0A3B1A1U8_9ZZZZ